jgi:hypothetical protein
MADFFQWKGDADIGIGYVGLPKGNPITVITATLTATLTGDTTYTGNATITGFNSILVEFTISSAGLTSPLTVVGAMSAGGTMIPLIDKDTSAQMTASFSASQTVRLVGLPDYVGFSLILSAGMTAGASATMKVLPINM